MQISINKFQTKFCFSQFTVKSPLLNLNKLYPFLFCHQFHRYTYPLFSGWSIAQNKSCLGTKYIERYYTQRHVACNQYKSLEQIGVWHMILRDVDVCNWDISETMWPPEQCLNKSVAREQKFQFSFLRRILFRFNSKTRELVKILTKHQLRWANSSLLLPPQVTATPLWCHWNTIVTGTTSINPQVPSKPSKSQTLDILICGCLLDIAQGKILVSFAIQVSARTALQGIPIQKHHTFVHRMHYY